MCYIKKFNCCITMQTKKKTTDTYLARHISCKIFYFAAKGLEINDIYTLNKLLRKPECLFELSFEHPCKSF